ncbi:MAG: UbiA family prenyltransferase [Planctomycetota bacterium]
MNLRAILELCRMSNLPTVWSNCLVGWGAGLLLFLRYDNPVPAADHASYISNNVELIFGPSLFLMLMISLLYCGGMVLNDYWDREIDAKERPGRPIPSGRVSPAQARNFAIGMIVAAALIPVLLALVERSPQSDFTRLIPPFTALGLLIGCIVLYNRVHSTRPMCVILMAMCRFLVIVTVGAFVAPWPKDHAWVILILGPASTLFLYTLAISIVARREAETKRLAGPKTIMNMIAAMPLLDAAWLLVMGLWPASLFCVACAGLTKLAHRKIPGS